MKSAGKDRVVPRRAYGVLTGTQWRFAVTPLLMNPLRLLPMRRTLWQLLCVNGLLLAAPSESDVRWLEPVAVWSSEETDWSLSLAWADWDGDGDLDLAVGNALAGNRVYANTGGGLISAWVSPQLDNTYAVAWGDWDGDGDLDLAVGNAGNPVEPNRVYENTGGALSLAWTSGPSLRPLATTR